MTEMILDELPSLRRERGRREAMERLLEEQRVDSDLKMRGYRSRPIRNCESSWRLPSTRARGGESESDQGRVLGDALARAAFSHERHARMDPDFEDRRPVKTLTWSVGQSKRSSETSGSRRKPSTTFSTCRRILSGKLQLEQEPVEFAALVTGCVQSLRPSAEGKQIALRLDREG